jgi:hypothetical protein
MQDDFPPTAPPPWACSGAGDVLELTGRAR